MPAILEARRLVIVAGVLAAAVGALVVTGGLAGIAQGTHDNPENCPVDPPWDVPLGDDDCDGFSTARELGLGTDPNVACGYTPGGSAASDVWPPDLMESDSVDLLDLLAFKMHFGQPSPPADARFDLDGSAVINIMDILQLKETWMHSCSP
jgi:hypothetical protein